MELFSYGTLESPALLRELIGRDCPREPAVLEGFARYVVRGERHPGVVAEPGARTQGTLWRGLEARDLAALDRYEGALYERRLLVVRTSAGAERHAHVYVVPDARRSALSREPWQPTRD